VRFMELGHHIGPSDEFLCSKLLDCFLRGVDGRPKINDLLNSLSACYRREFDKDWIEEL